MLHPLTLGLCLLIRVLVAVLNLRGTMNAGRAWAIYPHLPICCDFISIIAIGLYKTLIAGGQPGRSYRSPSYGIRRR